MDSQTDVQKAIQLKISCKKAETSQDNIKGRNGGLGRISRGDPEIRVCVRISRVALTEDTAMQALRE